MMNESRKLLLRFCLWLNGKMQTSEEYSKNDPEWIEVQNYANNLINTLKKQIS